MIFPLMPKGVEHLLETETVICYANVIFPLMPKGVEHQSARDNPFHVAVVIFPLMPKGVEHPLPIATSATMPPS